PLHATTLHADAVKSVNGEIFRSFVMLARERGSTPIVVVFPYITDLMPESKGRLGIASEVLQTKGIPYLDMTDCVSQVSPTKRFVRLHYSRVTNAAVAECLHAWIKASRR